MLSMRVNFLASQVVLRYCPSSVLADVPSRNIYAMGNRDQHQLHHVNALRHGQPESRFDAHQRAIATFSAAGSPRDSPSRLTRSKPYSFSIYTHHQLFGLQLEKSL